MGVVLSPDKKDFSAQKLNANFQSAGQKLIRELYV